MDPEKKRKAIGAGFIRVFDAFAKKLEAKHGAKPRFLVQVHCHTLHPGPASPAAQGQCLGPSASVTAHSRSAFTSAGHSGSASGLKSVQGCDMCHPVVAARVGRGMRAAGRRRAPCTPT